MNVYEKLFNIQQKLIVQKKRKTSRYSYRNAEDILQAVKPLLNEVKSCIFLKDEIEIKDSRFYVKATAIFIDIETGDKIEVFSFAREDESNKGMATSQVTGSSISYARKYALGGLLCINDGNDTDKQAEIDERMKAEERAEEEKKIKERGDKVRRVADEMKRTGIEEKEILQHFEIKRIRGASNETLDEIISWLKSIRSVSRQQGGGEGC